MVESRIAFPPDTGPSPTPFTLAIPEGWQTSTTMGADLAIIEPGAGEDGFRSSVLVSTRRLSAPVPVEVIKERVRAKVSALPQVALAYAGDVAVAGLPGFVAEYAFVKEPENVTVAQIQLNLLALVEDGGVDLITLIGSAGPVGAQEALDRLRQIMMSLDLAGDA